jgi:hypothetical protein
MTYGIAKQSLCSSRIADSSAMGADFTLILQRQNSAQTRVWITFHPTALLRKGYFIMHCL